MEPAKQNTEMGNSEQSSSRYDPYTWVWLNTEPELTQASDEEDDFTDEAALNASASPSECSPSQDDHISGTVTAYYGDLASGEDLGDDIWLNEDPMEQVLSKMETLQMGPSPDDSDFHKDTEPLGLMGKKQVGESASTESSETTEQGIPVMEDHNSSEATGGSPQIPAALLGPSSDSSVPELLRQLQEHSDRMLDIVKNLRAAPGTALNVEACYYALNSLKLAAAEVENGDGEGSN